MKEEDGSTGKGVGFPVEGEPAGPEIKPGQISLLQQVKEGLLADERVYFAGEIRKCPGDGDWTEMVSLMVAPQRQIFDIPGLNTFMKSLVPGVTPISVDEATYSGEESDVRLGKLYFDEVIGVTVKEIKSTTSSNEPEIMAKAGFPLGKNTRVEMIKHKRRTWVRVYPDTLLAKTVWEYEKGVNEGTIEPSVDLGHLVHWLTPAQFKRLKEANKLGRIAGLLKRGK